MLATVMDSSSESDFTIAGSDNENAETLEDPTPNIEKTDALVNEAATFVECASMETGAFKTSPSLKPCHTNSDVQGSEIVKVLERTVESSRMEPEVGMVFHSEDEAFEFYNSYAKGVGFSVRKGHLSKRKDGSVRVRIFLCSNEGIRQVHSSHSTKRPRFNERTNCKARIEFKVDRDGVWVVKKVILEHNHPLISPNQAYKLRSHRKIWHAQTFAFVGEDAHGTTEPRSKRIRDLEKGDAHVLLDFLKERQIEDPAFFYAIQLDEKDQLNNFFWADARSIVDYSYFGDAVLFDTTYLANKFGIPFAPFIGINHHKQPAVFGASLLLNESLESFVWLFRTFIAAMSGKQPKTIFTERCDAISEAVKEVFPNSCHRFCLWNVLKNSVKHLSHMYNKEASFSKEFKDCLYEGRSRDNFENGWQTLVNKYDLASNSWLQALYAAREKWSLVYSRDSFHGIMNTKQWYETMENLFRKYFDRKLPISKFLERYQKALARFREKELFEDYKSRQNKSVHFSNITMLDEVADSYTRLMYSDFEDELKNQFACVCEPVAMDGTVYTFKVSLPKEQSYGLVEFNPSGGVVTCSCKKFESMGILCMHALKVLSNNNILHLPSQYVLKRWTKYAKGGFAPYEHHSGVGSEVQETLNCQYARACHKAFAVAVKSAASVDVLGFFERGLENLMMEVEHMVHNAPLFIEEGRRKHQLKDGPQEKRKRIRGVDDSIHMSNSEDHSQNKGQNPSSTMIINEQSCIAPYSQDSATTYYNTIQMQPNGVSAFQPFPPEAVIPTQDLFTPSQGIYDSAMASQGSSNSTLPRGDSANPVGVSIPVLQGQANNFSNWEVQAFNVQEVVASQHHLEQQMHSTLPTQQQLPRTLNLDINKGN